MPCAAGLSIDWIQNELIDETQEQLPIADSVKFLGDKYWKLPQTHGLCKGQLQSFGLGKSILHMFQGIFCKWYCIYTVYCSTIYKKRKKNFKAGSFKSEKNNVTGLLTYI